MKSLGTIVLSLQALALGACYNTTLDPDLTGVFACTVDDETSCPTGQTCINERCEDIDAVPTLTIINPEEGDKELTDALDYEEPGPDATPVMVNLSFQGSNLDLVTPSTAADPEFGLGYVAIYVDGAEAATLEAGNIAERNTVMLELSPEPGAHRIAIRAHRNDGVAYDNAEAFATRLIWFENRITEGERPFVAIRSPWPGTTFDLEDQQIEVQVMTLNFTLEASDASRHEEKRGHAHIYYEDTFPSCSEDEICDDGYIGVAAAAAGAEKFSRGDILLPASGADGTSLTAVLRNIDHRIYEHPYECELTAPDTCNLIFDEIEILRTEG